MEDYVKQIDERSVQVVALTPGNIKAIGGLGGVAGSTSADTWRIDYDTEDQLANLLQALRDAGLAFAGGSAGWPPAAVAEMLRDKGKLHGVIREAIWLGPNQQIVRDL
jgi:hypothetical protein